MGYSDPMCHLFWWSWDCRFDACHILHGRSSLQIPSGARAPDGVSGLLSPAWAGSPGTTEAQVQLQRLWLLLRLWKAGRTSTQQKRTRLVPLLQRSGTFCPNSQASQGWKKLLHFSLQQLVPLFCIFSCPLRVPQLYFQHCVLFLFLV